MGRRRKKRKASAGACPGSPDKQESSDEIDADDNEQNGSASAESSSNDEEFDVSFEFTDPCEDDYHSVSGLLKSGTWDFMELNFAELADSLVGQGNIGTLVKSGADGSVDDATVCGLLTALNFRQFSHVSWPKSVAQALVAKAERHADSGVAKNFEEVLERPNKKDGEVGLLLTERFANLPPALIAPLYAALQDDIEWSCTTPECPEEERPFYRFSRFVGVARCFGPTDAATGAPAERAGAKRKKRRRVASHASSGPGDATQLVFPLAEQEACMRRASLSFTFPVQAPAEGQRRVARGAKGQRQERRAVFVLTRQALSEVVTELKAGFPP